MGARTGNVFTVCSNPLSQSIGRGRISRVGPLVVRESRERREKDFAGKTEKITRFWPEIFRFFEQDHLLFARVGIGLTNFPTKTKEKTPHFF